MTGEPGFIRATDNGVVLAIRAQPRASRNEIGPVENGALKLRVTAPPVDSAANTAIVKLLASKLGCSKSQVRLVKGKTSRQKTIEIVGAAMEDVLAKLNG